MAKNRMQDLRNHLFETLEALKDNEKPMELDRAKTICLVSQTIINSATVEVKFLNAAGGDRDTGSFFEERDGPRLEPVPPLVQRRLG